MELLCSFSPPQAWEPFECAPDPITSASRTLGNIHPEMVHWAVIYQGSSTNAPPDGTMVQMWHTNTPSQRCVFVCIIPVLLHLFTVRFFVYLNPISHTLTHICVFNSYLTQIFTQFWLRVSNENYTHKHTPLGGGVYVSHLHHRRMDIGVCITQHARLHTTITTASIACFVAAYWLPRYVTVLYQTH